MSLAIVLVELVHRACSHIHTLARLIENHVLLGAFRNICLAVLDGQFDGFAVEDDGANRLSAVGAAAYHGEIGLHRVHGKRDDSVGFLPLGNQLTSERVVEERGLRVAKVACHLNLGLCLCASCQTDGGKHTHKKIPFHCFVI